MKIKVGRCPLYKNPDKKLIIFKDIENVASHDESSTGARQGWVQDLPELFPYPQFSLIKTNIYWSLSKPIPNQSYTHSQYTLKSFQKCLRTPYTLFTLIWYPELQMFLTPPPPKGA